MNAMLCSNCLENTSTTKKVPVGHDNGTQRDPWRYEVALCEPCRYALLAGDWTTIHARFSAERRITQPLSTPLDMPHPGRTTP